MMPAPEMLAATIDRIATQTYDMLAVAQSCDWERLVELEGARQPYFVKWRQASQEGVVPPESSRETMLAIQAMDTEIRQLVASRLGALKEELTITTKRQKLAQYYGS